MSIHINMTEEAEHEINSQKRRNLITASLTAVLSVTLLGILLYIAVVVIPTVEKPEVAAYQMDDSDAPPTDRPTTPERTRSRPSAPTQSQASIITTTAPTETAVVSVDVDMPTADIAISDGDIGTGWGSDGGTDGTGFGGSSGGGSTLEGTFYDFKQTQGGVQTGMKPTDATALMREFILKKWNPSNFAKYFKAPKKLYASQFYISRRRATEAPKAYGCEDRVKDSRWCAVYRGKIVAPKSGKFRFVGAGDDNVTVRFNNEVVFDYGFYCLSMNRNTPINAEIRNVMAGKSKNEGLKKQIEENGIIPIPTTFYTYSSMPHWNRSINGVAAGKIFEVKAGEVYPIEVLITEIPGGEFGAALLIEEIGATPAKKDSKTGSPILPLFRTNYALPKADELKGIGGDIVPFDPIGVVWQSVK